MLKSLPGRRHSTRFGASRPKSQCIKNIILNQKYMCKRPYKKTVLRRAKSGRLPATGASVSRITRECSITQYTIWCSQAVVSINSVGFVSDWILRSGPARGKGISIEVMSSEAVTASASNALAEEARSRGTQRPPREFSARRSNQQFVALNKRSRTLSVSDLTRVRCTFLRGCLIFPRVPATT